MEVQHGHSQRHFAKKVDGCFTRLLRSALGFTWKDHVSYKELYAEVQKATDTVKEKILKLAGHCYRHPEEATSNQGPLFTASEGEEYQYVSVCSSCESTPGSKNAIWHP